MSATEASGGSIGVFLGAEESAGGPFALLGLDAGVGDAAMIGAALESQLRRVDRHPQGKTPAGDEVRLALHAAAAQLLDPAVRREMELRWGGAGGGGMQRVAVRAEGRVGAGERVAAERGAAGGVSDAVMAGLEAEALRVMGACGGATGEAMRRIAMLASARGVGAAEIPGLVRLVMVRRAEAGGAGAIGRGLGEKAGGVGGGRPVSFVSTSATGGAGEVVFEASPFGPRDVEDDRAARAIKLVAMFSVLGIVMMAGAFWAVLVLTTPKGAAPGAVRPAGSLIGQTPEPERPEALFPRGPAGEAAGVETARPVASVADPAALAEEFRACIAAQGVDPVAASAAFRELNARAGAGWDTIPLDRRRAIVDLVVEYVYRAAGSAEGPVAAIEDAGAGAAGLGGAGWLSSDEVARASWSIGLLVRLQRERDISARAGSLIEARLGAALEGARPIGASAFDAGAAAALGVMPARLIPTSSQSARTREVIEEHLEAWRRWLACVKIVCGSDGAARTGLILSGLEVLIHDAPQPTDDRLIFEAMGLLVESLDWSASGPARAWLVRALDAPGVSTADAHALSNAVATVAPAAGLDVSLVLAPRATDLERREMRDRLAILWNLSDQGDYDALASAWREGWADGLARRDSDLTPFEHLATAVVLSRVSEAALLRWRGQTGEADALLLGLSGEVDATLTAAARPGPAVSVNEAGDGVWADQYLQAGRSIPIRLDLLQQASRTMSSSIGAVDAEVLMDEAVRGSPAPVATAAYDIVMRLVGSPSVVNALLEELPQLPKTRRNAQLVGALTGARLPLLRDKRWELEARRATVTRLLELLAADGELRTYDDLSVLLARSYEARAEFVMGAGVRDPDPPELVAGVLRAGWRRQAEPLLPPPALGLTLDEVERRRASRLELAEGPVQTFAAEQLAGVELMALVVAGEQPEQVDAVRSVLGELARARQRARHITEQIVAGEAASAALWGIRLKEGASP